jgi:hypothetical protein
MVTPPVPPAVKPTPPPPPTPAPYVTPAVPAVPVPPVAPRAPAPSISALGIKVDEFADIMVDDAARAPELNQVFKQALQDRKTSQMTISQAEFMDEGKRRSYHVITGPARTTLLANISPFGKDLILSWEMYIKRGLKWLPIAIMAGAAVILALISFLVAGFAFYVFWTQFFAFLLYAGLAGLLLGKILKDDWMYLFVEDIDEISWAEGNALQLVVHEALLETMETFEVEQIAPARKNTAKPAPKAVVKKPAKPVAKPKPRK